MLSWTAILTWMATYWLHSSLLLGAVWIWFHFRKPASHALSEWVWKLAAVAGIFTATLQLGLNIESPANATLRMVLQPAVDHVEAPETTVKDVALTPQPISGSTTFPPEKMAEFEPTWIVVHDPVNSEISHPIDTHFIVEPIKPAVVSVPLVASDRSTTTETLNRKCGEPNSDWGLIVQRTVTAVIMGLGGAILAICTFGIFRLGLDHLGFLRRMRSYQTLTRGTSRTILDQLLRSTQVQRRVDLLLAEEEVEPGAWGLLKWRIVLPPRATVELTDEELRALLAHELAHLVRRDQWWIWGGYLLTIGFGWQPMNRIAFREWRKSAEYLCDAWAVEHRTPRLTLARCLTSVAEWRMTSVAPMAGVRGETQSSLVSRVERLVDAESLQDPWLNAGRRQLLVSAGCLVAVAMICFAPAATLHARGFGEATRSSHLSQEFGVQTHEDDSTRLQSSLPHSSSFEDVLQDQFHRQDDSNLSTVVDNNGEVAARLLLSQNNHETIRALMLDITSEFKSLIAELSNLESEISQTTRTGDAHSLRIRLQRIQIRLESFRRLQNTLVNQFQL